jgi:hypothetical protein
MRYLLLHCMPEQLSLTEPEQAEVDADLAAWIGETVAAGANLHGAKLARDAATCVRRPADEVIVTDGPFAETKEQIAGYDVLECPSLEEAVRWAARHPSARLGSIEVRELWAGDTP